MRTGQQNKRGRGRNNNNNNNNRKHSNPLSRSYDSTGPDVKVRGTAQHVAEKYMTLARDAQSSGDRVMAENYLQHAEHYNRIIAVGQAQMQERQQREEAAREQQQQQQQERDAQNETNNVAVGEADVVQDATQGENAATGGNDDRAERKPQPRRRNNQRPRRPRVQDAAVTETSDNAAPVAATPVIETPVSETSAPVDVVEAPAKKVRAPKAKAEKVEAPTETVASVETTTPAE